jgi:L-serine dehydratase
MGAVKAYNAFLIATMEIPSHHLVSFDVVIRTMAETGKDMSAKYKETSEGGLALHMVTCSFRRSAISAGQNQSSPA